MSLIHLTAWDLALAAALVVALGMLSVPMRLGLARPLLIAAARAAIQLYLIGLVLNALFGAVRWYWVALTALIMLAAAGYEVYARQQKPFAGWFGVAIGPLSLFVSSFAIVVLTLTVVVAPTPWYHPQYAIPVLGMLLGNTMTGVALALDRLTDGMRRDCAGIEGRLLLGQTARQATLTHRQAAWRAALVPTLNAMATAGIVSLPGMMTGQILAGSPPVEAAKYQWLILLLIVAGTGFGVMIAVEWGCRRLFDDRQRLRLERLRTDRNGVSAGKPH